MLLDWIIILITGYSIGYLFSWLKLPKIIGMIVAGMLIGPYGLNLISFSYYNTESIINSSTIRTIALMIILMRAGLSLKVKDFYELGVSAILICFIPAIFEIIAVAMLCTLFLSTTFLESILIGAVVAAVSPAIIVPRMIGLIHKGYGTNKKIPQFIMAGGAIDDLFVIVLFTSIVSILSTGSYSFYSMAFIPLSIISAIIVGILFGILTHQTYQVITNKYNRAITIPLVFAIILNILELVQLPLNSLLSIFVMTFTLKQLNSPKLPQLEKELTHSWFLLEIALFTIVGISINIDYIYHIGFITIIIIIVSLVFRLIGVYICMIKTNFNVKEKLFCMLSYTPKATVQAGIGSIPLSLGLPCGEVVLSFAILSILITAPLGAICIDTLHSKLLKKEVKSTL